MGIEPTEYRFAGGRFRQSANNPWLGTELSSDLRVPLPVRLLGIDPSDYFLIREAPSPVG